MNEQAGICAEVENSLPLFVGGDLEADAMVEIERHVGVCSACAARAAEARRARATLISALKLRGSGPDLWSGVRAVLAEEGLLAPRAIEGSRAPRSAQRERQHETLHARRPRLLPLSLAAAAAVIFGVWVGSHFFAQGPRGGRNDGTSVSPRFVERTPSNSMPNGLETPVPSGSGVESAGNLLAGKDSLRRLAPGEPRLSRGAEIFVSPREADWSPDATSFDDPSAGSPVGLKRVGRRP